MAGINNAEDVATVSVEQAAKTLRRVVAVAEGVKAESSRARGIDASPCTVELNWGQIDKSVKGRSKITRRRREEKATRLRPNNEVFRPATNVTVIPPNGVTVIEQGAGATARIVKAEGGKSFGRAGKLAWEMKEVVAVDGSKIPLSFNKGMKGDSSGGTVATGIIVTSLLFWPAAPFWGFKHGKAAVLPAGKRFEVFVHGESVVKVAPGLRAENHNRSGLLLFGQRKLNEAESEFRQAVSLDPNNALYRHNLGAVLSNEGKWDEAEAEISQAIRLNPAEPSYRASLELVQNNRRGGRQVIRVN